MSYVRRKMIKGNVYLYEEESYRDESGNSRTRHIAYIGPENSGGAIEYAAVQKYGTTENPYDAGYVTRDGRMLNLEKEHENTTHSEVTSVLSGKTSPEEKARIDKGGTEAAIGVYLDKTGDQRLFVHRSFKDMAVQLTRRPSPEQNKRIKAIWDVHKARHGEEATLTVEGSRSDGQEFLKGKTLHSFEAYRRETEILPE